MKRDDRRRRAEVITIPSTDERLGDAPATGSWVGREAIMGLPLVPGKGVALPGTYFGIIHGPAVTTDLSEGADDSPALVPSGHPRRAGRTWLAVLLAVLFLLLGVLLFHVIASSGPHGSIG